MATTSGFELRFTKYSNKSGVRLISGPGYVQAVDFRAALALAEAMLEGMRSICNPLVLDLKIAKVEHVSLCGTHCASMHDIWAELVAAVLREHGACR